MNEHQEDVTSLDDSANFRIPSPVKRKFSLQENGEERKVALLTGVTGQDGSYLCEFLLDKVSIACRTACGRRVVRLVSYLVSCPSKTASLRGLLSPPVFTTGLIDGPSSPSTGLRGTWYCPPFFIVQHLPHRAFVP